MASRYYSAVAQDTTITNTITSSSTSVTVAGTTGYPSTYPFVLALDYNTSNEELVTVTSAAGLTLNITRGYNGTTAVAHNPGAVVRHVITAQDLTDAQNHYGATTSVHGIADTSKLAVNLSFNAQTGTSYTLVASDASKLVTLNNSSNIAVTVPAGIFTAGQQINVQATGTGAVTIQGDGTTTLTSTGATSNAPVLRTQYSAATIICTATNTFTVVGDFA
jgi:hypothetical protein